MTSPIMWKDFFQAVLTESDSSKLPERIFLARTAIMDRVNMLLEDRDRKPEHDEILFALNKLELLSPHTTEQLLNSGLLQQES